MVQTVNGNGFSTWRRNIVDRLLVGRAEGQDISARITEIEAVLRDVNLRRETLEAEIAAAGEQERSYATAGNDYTDVVRLRTKASRLQWDLEQLTAAEGPLVEELAALRSKQRAELWARLVTAHDAAAEAYIHAAEVLLVAHAELRQAIERPVSAGFETERFHRMLALGYPIVVADDIVARMRAEFDSKRGLPTAPLVPPQPKASPVAAGARKRLPHEVGSPRLVHPTQRAPSRPGAASACRSAAARGAEAGRHAPQRGRDRRRPAPRRRQN
jgi:hypothetical protein